MAIPELNSMRQMQMYVLTIMHGLQLAVSTYQAAVTEREEHINESLQRFTEYVHHTQGSDTKTVVKLVKEHPELGMEETIDKFNRLFEDVFGFRYEQLSARIGDKYEAIHDMEHRARAQFENLYHALFEPRYSHGLVAADPRTTIQLAATLIHFETSQEFRAITIEGNDILESILDLGGKLEHLAVDYLETSEAKRDWDVAELKTQLEEQIRTPERERNEAIEDATEATAAWMNKLK